MALLAVSTTCPLLALLGVQHVAVDPLLPVDERKCPGRVVRRGGETREEQPASEPQRPALSEGVCQRDIQVRHLMADINANVNLFSLHFIGISLLRITSPLSTTFNIAIKVNYNTE